MRRLLPHWLNTLARQAAHMFIRCAALMHGRVQRKRSACVRQQLEQASRDPIAPVTLCVCRLLSASMQLVTQRLLDLKARSNCSASLAICGVTIIRFR